jgi:hypothetical protein
MIDRDHLYRVKENYFVHLVYAVRLAVGLLFLSVVSLIHGLFPFILTNFVSKHIKSLNEVLDER